MTLRHILPLAAAVLLAAGCGADDVTSPSASEAARQMGVNMGGSGGYTAPGAPRMDGSQMGGSGGFVPVDTTTITSSGNGATTPSDSTTIAERGSQMGGSGG